MSSSERERIKRRGLRASAFTNFAVPLPVTFEQAKRRSLDERSQLRKAAKLLLSGEGPLSGRSAAMIDQLRQRLKMTIKELRGDMTQAEFAQRIGIRQAALARMESLNNEVFPSTPMLIRIALVSGRDLQLSFVKRTEDTIGADMLLADTYGFPTSAELKDYRVVFEEGYPSSSDDNTPAMLPVHAAIEK
jgi:transcriptional regulator with XRE-family HTH domain